MKKIRNNFITGLVTIIPIAFVGWVINLVYTPISNIIGSVGWLPLLVGVAITLVAILLLGWGLSHIKLLSKVKELIEVKLIHKVPIVKTIYKFSHDLVENTLENKVYDETVIAYPFGRDKAGLIAFLTNKDTHTVFAPSSPNPLSGHVYMYCDYDLINLTYDQAVKGLMSVGLSIDKIELLK